MREKERVADAGADELVDLGRERQLAIAGQPVEELGHEGMEPLRPNAPGGLPEDRERLGLGLKAYRIIAPRLPK